jgi:Asp-tRNA(Asn)/Glu-tRNA(Gln) amidotransferase A subunit family amidase
MSLIPDDRQTIVGAAAALALGEMTCERLLDTCLERIDVCDKQVQAWVSVDREAACNRARQCDAELASRRSEGSVERLSPLFGMPIGIKDIIDIAGQPTGAGSQLLSTGPPAEHDATVVRKLREAGAVVLGKTVTTQFACFDPPPTRNPWNLDHTPGGSSSGSAAGVAAGMCLGAIGSQTGGSIIRPAAFCGVAACKPTYGRVSCDGFVPVAPSLDTAGPIGTCVADVAILLSAISDDPLTFDAELLPDTIKPPRLIRVGGFFESMVEPSMRAALDQAIGRLRSARATIVERESPPSFAEIHSRHRTMMGYELAGWHRDRFREHRDDYLPGLAALIQECLAISAADYTMAREWQRRATVEVEEIFADADGLICPAARGSAPDLTTTGDPSIQSPWTFTGHPTITFPIGSSPGGLPLGIQLVGRRFGEAGLFRAAAWCEDILSRVEPKTRSKQPAG